MKRPSRTLIPLEAPLPRHAHPRKPRGYARAFLAATLLVYPFSYSLGIAADLIGTVLQDGRPAAKATVELTPRGAQQPVKTSTTDESGRYTLTGIVPGSYQLKCTLAKREKTLTIDVGYAVNRRDCSL